MKKLLSIMTLVMLSFTASCATEYKEGEHYTKVSDTLSAGPEVREFFSFYCPHCFRAEPFFADVKKQLPSDVKFVRNHVDFLRAASPEIQQLLTKSIVVAQQLDIENLMVGKIFNYIHVQRAVFASERDIRNLFMINGIDGEKFDKASKSFTTNGQAKLLKKKQDYYSGKRALTGVPATIVNGKYRINMQTLKNGSTDETVTDYVNLVKHIQTLDTFK